VVIALIMGVAQPFRLRAERFGELAAALAQAVRAASQSALVHARVVDAQGQSVPGLTAGDFEILLDGEPTPVLSAAPRSTLSLAVVVDTSRSAHWGGGIMPMPHDHVLAVLAGLRDDDRLRFGSFGQRVRFAKRWEPVRARNLRNELRDALSADDREMHGPSPIWDVVYDTVTMLADEPPPRAVLLLTDGRSTGNLRSLEMAADYAAIHGVAVHSILRNVEMQIPQGDRLEVAVRPWVALDRLARYTGGTSVAFRIDQNLRGLTLAENLGHAIRDTYALAFSPGAAGAVQRIEVRARRIDLNAIAPMAFQAPASR
jgi:hypothetical protein